MSDLETIQTIRAALRVALKERDAARAQLARTTERAEGYVRQLEEAEDRIDAVIALCSDGYGGPKAWVEGAQFVQAKVRAAATGETS